VRVKGCPGSPLTKIIKEKLIEFHFRIDYSPNEQSGLASGGLVIGILERSILYLLLLLNSPGGIGFLITTKTLFRFGEISAGGKNRLQVEYILIGSLMSFFVGGAISVMWMFLIQSLFPGMPFKLLGNY
jgi:hypothetical protein